MYSMAAVKKKLGEVGERNYRNFNMKVLNTWCLKGNKHG